MPPLPEPEVASTRTPYSILIAGVGGTGIVTVGALLGMAAHLEGKGVTVLDVTGLSQKAGAVLSHVRIADRQECLHAARIPAGEADTIIAADLVVAVRDEVLASARHGFTRAIVNTHLAITGQFIGDPDFSLPLEAMQKAARDAVGLGRVDFLDATRLATALLGDSIATNVFLLGFACQNGLLPVSVAALLAAIELNGAEPRRNREAFLWGRHAARDPAAVAHCAGLDGEVPVRGPRGLDAEIAFGRAYLERYQNAAYAARYVALVERVRAAEGRLGVAAPLLSEAVARSYRKLLAAKDEYEVARLYADPVFARSVEAAFEGNYRVVFHFGWSLRDGGRAAGDAPRKRRFGPGFIHVLRTLARLRGLRATRLDPFQGRHERARDRRLVAEYERTIDEILGALDRDNWEQAVAVASVAETIRGFGPVRTASVADADARLARLLEQFRAARTEAAAA